MKKMFCGFAWILFGIAMILAAFIDAEFLFFINLPYFHIGYICAIIGLVIVIKESRKP